MTYLSPTATGARAGVRGEAGKSFGKSLSSGFRRVLNAMYAARMRQAEREVARVFELHGMPKARPNDR